MAEKLQKYDVEYLKTYLSLNSVAGCPVGCKYCFLSPLGISPARPTKITEESELVNKLLNSPYFVPGETVLSLNNRTEPFFNEFTRESTFKILDLLNQNGLNNPTTITTKGRLSKEDVSYLDSLDNLNLFLIITYNGLPEEVEPLDHKIQLDTMINLKENTNKVNIFHQFRPIIIRYNDSHKKIQEVLSVAQNYCDCSIFAGLRLNESIRERMEKEGLDIKMDLSPEHKYLSPTFVDQIMEISSEEYPDYPIFRHTSCALSWRLSIPDFNAHWSKGQCYSNCYNYRRCNEGKRKPDEERVKGLFEKLNLKNGFEMKKDLLFIEGEISQEDRSFLRHNLKYPVKSESLKKTLSEEVMSK